MSKAITSCKKALAYLLTAAMVLGMAVTSPITAVDVKAGEAGYVVLASNADAKITLTSATQIVEETSTSVLSNGTAVDPTKAITVKVTPETGKWITGVSATGTGLTAYSANIEEGWDENRAVEFEIPANSIDGVTFDGNISVDATVVDCVTTSEEITAAGEGHYTLEYDKGQFDGYLGEAGSDGYAEKGKRLGFKVEAEEGYVVNKIAVKIADHTDGTGYGNGTNGKSLTLNDSGEYSIDGSDVVGNVTITVEAVAEKSVEWDESTNDYVISPQPETIGEGQTFTFTVQKGGVAIDPKYVQVLKADKDSTPGDEDYSALTPANGVYSVTQATGNIYIKIASVTQKDIKLSAACPDASVVLDDGNDTIITDTSEGIKATKGIGFKFVVTPVTGHRITKVEVDVDGDEDYDLAQDGDDTGELKLNNSPEIGDAWELEVTNTGMNDLADGATAVLIRVTAPSIEYPVTLNIKSDKSDASIPDDYLESGGIKAATIGGNPLTTADKSAANTLIVDSLHPNYKGLTYNKEVWLYLKKANDATGLGEPKVSATKNVTIDDEEKDVKVTIDKIGTEADGDYVYKVSGAAGKDYENLTINVEYQYPYTIEVTPAGNKDKMTYEFYATTGSSNFVKVSEDNAETAVYRVKDAEKVGINVTGVAEGSSVSVTSSAEIDGTTTDFSGTGNGKLSTNGVGKWQTAENISTAKTTFTVTENTPSYTLKDTSDAADGCYVLGRKQGDSVWKALSELSASYGDKVELQVYNKNGSSDVTDHTTLAKNKLSAEDSIAASGSVFIRIDAKMGDEDISSTVLSGYGNTATATVSTINMKGNVEIGVRAKNVTINQTNDLIMDADKELVVVKASNNTQIANDEKVKYNQPFSFKIMKKNSDGTLSNVSADKNVRVKYKLDSSKPGAAADYNSEAAATNGVYNIDHVTNNLWIKAEYVYTVNVTINKDVDVSGNNTRISVENGDTATAGTNILDSISTPYTHAYEYSWFDISGSANGATKYLNIKTAPTDTTNYESTVTVDGEVKTATNDIYSILLNKPDPTSTVTPQATLDKEYNIPENIVIGVKPKEVVLTINVDDLKSTNAAVKVYEKDSANALTPETKENTTAPDTYKLKVTETYRVELSGLNTTEYTTDSTAASYNGSYMCETTSAITNKYKLADGVNGEKNWEISGVTTDATLSFGEEHIADTTLSVSTDAGASATVYTYKYFATADTETGKTGYLKKATSVAASNSSTDNVGFYAGYADVEVRVNLEDKFIIDSVKLGTNEITTKNSSGYYVISKSLLKGDTTDTITIKTKPDPEKYHNVKLIIGKNVSLDTFTGTLSKLDGASVPSSLSSTAAEGLEETILITSGTTIGFTVGATASSGYEITGVTKSGPASFTASPASAITGSYTLTFAESTDVGSASDKMATITITSAPVKTSRDVYVKLADASQDHLSAEITGGVVEDGAVKIASGSAESELSLKVSVDKGYVLTGTPFTDIASCITSLGDPELSGDKLVYSYTISGSKITANASLGQTAAAAHTITVKAPKALQVIVENGSNDSESIDWKVGDASYTALAQNATTSAFTAGQTVDVQITAAQYKKYELQRDDVAMNLTESEDGLTWTGSFDASLKDEAGLADTNYVLKLVERTGDNTYELKVHDGTNYVTPVDGVVEFDYNSTPAKTYRIEVYEKKANGDYVQLTTASGTAQNVIYPFKDGELQSAVTAAGYGITNYHGEVAGITQASIDDEVTYTFKSVKIASGVKTEKNIDGLSITFRCNGKPATLEAEGHPSGDTLRVAQGDDKTEIKLIVKDTNGNVINEPAIGFAGNVTKDKYEKIEVSADKGVISIKVANDAIIGTTGTFTAQINGGADPDTDVFTFTVEVKKPITIKDATITGSVSSLKIGGSSKELKVTKIMGKKDGSDTAADVTSEIADSDIKVETTNNNVSTSVTNKVITITPVKEGEDTITITIGEWSKTYPVTVKPESSVPEETKGNIYIYVNDYSYPCATIEGVIGKTISKEDVEDAALAALGNVEYLEGWYKNSTLRTRWDFATDVVEENTVIYGRALHEVKDEATEKTARIQEVWPQTYTGSVIKPSVVVTDENGNLLKLNKDYKVSYNERNGDAKLGKDANVELGGYSSDPETEAYYFTVNFVNDYKALGSRKVHYDIQPVNLNDAIVTLSDKTGQFVTDKNIKPVSSVKYGKKTLKLGTDYEYEVYNYENEVVATCSGTSYKGQKFDAGYYYIKLKGKAPNFVDQEYSDTNYYPQMVVQDAAKLVKNMTITNIKALALTEDKDSGEIIPSVPTFEIKAKDMPKAVIFEGKEGVAEDKSGTPVGSWSDDGYYWTFSNTKKEDQFRVYIFNNESVGKKAEIYVEGCGYEGYFGEKTVKFAIKASGKLVKNDLIDKDMQKKLAAVENVYCGEGITIEDIIENMNAGGAEYNLDSIVSPKYILGTHYIITYKKNVNKGTATMTFKGLGIYAGSSFTQNFKIVPATLDLCVGDDNRVVSTKIVKGDDANVLELSANNWEAKGKSYVIKADVLNGKEGEEFLYDTVAEKNLTLKKDFTVTYKVVGGVQKAIIKGSNNYSGKSGKTVPTFEVTMVPEE